MKETSHQKIGKTHPIITPKELKEKLPVSDSAKETVVEGRQEIINAINCENKRLLVLVGPCSIHDEDSALSYAERLAELRKEVSKTMILVMRVYFEKPRTSVGWKGWIMDPYLDDSCQIEEGLHKARKLLMKINEMGLPCGTEFLEPIVPAYISDLVTWCAIGARTTESQVHREMASGLSMPVGFKNATSGDIYGAINGMLAAKNRHTFLGIDRDGRVSLLKTKGNEDVHLILRGGSSGTNFSVEHLELIQERLHDHQGKRLIMVDCSHANAAGDFRNQSEVFQKVLTYYTTHPDSILGMMLESNLFEGKQNLQSDLQYGVSITDPCIGWEETEHLIESSHQILEANHFGS